MVIRVNDLGSYVKGKGLSQVALGLQIDRVEPNHDKSQFDLVP